jgi:hypothetical protein
MPSVDWAVRGAADLPELLAQREAAVGDDALEQRAAAGGGVATVGGGGDGGGGSRGGGRLAAALAGLGSLGLATLGLATLGLATLGLGLGLAGVSGVGDGLPAVSCRILRAILVLAAAEEMEEE